MCFIQAFPLSREDVVHKPWFNNNFQRLLFPTINFLWIPFWIALSKRWMYQVVSITEIEETLEEAHIQAHKNKKIV